MGLYTLGFSIFNLNKPNQSLVTDQEEPLGIRWSVQGSMTLPQRREWEYQPSVFYNRQVRQQELIVGIIAKNHRYSKPEVNTVVFGGVFTRIGDAAILMLGIEYEYLNFALSYDVNYSGLRKASYLRGGLEVSVQYTFQKPQGVTKRGVTCPTF